MKKYYVRSGTKIECLMGVAKNKTEVGFIYYWILKILGFDVFVEKGK